MESCSEGTVAYKMKLQENPRTLGNILKSALILNWSPKAKDCNKKHMFIFLGNWIQGNIFFNDALRFQGCPIIEWAKSSGICNKLMILSWLSSPSLMIHRVKLIDYASIHIECCKLIGYSLKCRDIAWLCCVDLPWAQNESYIFLGTTWGLEWLKKCSQRDFIPDNLSI